MVGVKEAALKERGIIYVSGTIDAAMAERVCTEIIEMNVQRSVDAIQFIVNSPGGSVSDGFAIIDMMEWSQLPIRMTGLGIIGSMGLLLFMAGAQGHRVITPRVSILSHRFLGWSIGNHSELIAKRKEEDHVHQRIVDHYLRHTTVGTAERLHQTLLREVDTWLTPEEAVSYGIADVIQSPRAGGAR
jgi:ATP-dependent Clp protease protease subunit